MKCTVMGGPRVRRFGGLGRFGRGEPGVEIAAEHRCAAPGSDAGLETPEVQSAKTSPGQLGLRRNGFGPVSVVEDHQAGRGEVVAGDAGTRTPSHAVDNDDIPWRPVRDGPHVRCLIIRFHQVLPQGTWTTRPRGGCGSRANQLASCSTETISSTRPAWANQDVDEPAPYSNTRTRGVSTWSSQSTAG